MSAYQKGPGGFLTHQRSHDRPPAQLQVPAARPVLGALLPDEPHGQLHRRQLDEINMSVMRLRLIDNERGSLSYYYILLHQYITYKSLDGKINSV